MSDEDLVGTTIGGKYRVETVLGKGGMGIVVGARHIKLDEPVAIKVLRASMMEVDGMVSRFLREARAASKIKSEHVVRVTDVDTRDDGVPYMVMEHLTGHDLAEFRKDKGQIPVSEAVGWVIEACDAIAEAHQLGIVHRDLKPGNLFLHSRRDGRREIKVLDFGISKIDSPGEQDTTKTGQMMGSPKYMSPEQMTSMSNVDGRSDIWSLGAILYDLVCGRPPFVGDTTPRICALVLNSDPPLPSAFRPDLPHDLELILLRCLDKEPDRRFPDVQALVAALSPFAPARPAPDLTASGARDVVAPVTLGGNPPYPPPPASKPSATPIPASQGATVAAWDTTRYVGPVKKSRSGRAIAIGAGLFTIAGAAALYASQQRGAPAAPPTAEPVTTAASSSASASATAAIQPAVTPNDLPDVDPVAPKSAAPNKPAASAPAVKKPKPSSDPFGGRRH